MTTQSLRHYSLQEDAKNFYAACMLIVNAKGSNCKWVNGLFFYSRFHHQPPVWGDRSNGEIFFLGSRTRWPHKNFRNGTNHEGTAVGLLDGFR
jgi:hypothetical protein